MSLVDLPPRASVCLSWDDGLEVCGGHSAGWPIWEQGASERTAGHVLGPNLMETAAPVLSVQSPAPTCLCARHGLIGRGRRWAERKLKIMEHFAPKESEAEEYSGPAGQGQRGRGQRQPGLLG